MDTDAFPDHQLKKLLGRDYWLVTWKPEPATTPDDIAALVHEHVSWLLELEEQGVVLASGPLVSGPDSGAAFGATVLRAPDEHSAREVASRDPFVLAGLRTFVIHGWRLNEGSITIRLPGHGRLRVARLKNVALVAPLPYSQEADHHVVPRHLPARQHRVHRRPVA